MHILILLKPFFFTSEEKQIRKVLMLFLNLRFMNTLTESGQSIVPKALESPDWPFHGPLVLHAFPFRVPFRFSFYRSIAANGYRTYNQNHLSTADHFILVRSRTLQIFHVVDFLS